MTDETPHPQSQDSPQDSPKELPKAGRSADEDFHSHDPYGMGEPPAEGTTVRAGAPKNPALPVATKDAVVEALKTIYDPEIPVNIYDLGLIYDLKIEDNGDALVTMTLTAPACPVAGSMPRDVAERVSAVEGIGEVDVVLTWDPPWTPANMSEVAKVALDMF